MPSFPYETVDVFTDRAFGGNQLAVFTDARGLSDAQMQSLAAEMNYSETTFVLPPDDPANDARVRIFTRSHEMPFAGHPNVGTAYVLVGVLADRQQGGAALIAIDGKAAKPYRVGATVDGQLIVQSVVGRRAVLATSRDGPAQMTLELPPLSK